MKNEVYNQEVPPGFEEDLKNIAVDFDGVIHGFDKGYHDGTCYGEPLPGAFLALRTLAQDYNVIVFSARAREDRPLVEGQTGIQQIWDWLHKYKMNSYVYAVTATKPRARCYIDDKAIRFENWDDVLKWLE